MEILICDRCQARLASYIFCITYSGYNKVDLCEKCAEDFKAFLQPIVRQNQCEMSEQERWRKGLD
jgi:protein-arginine kinase activator protein McsA